MSDENLENLMWDIFKILREFDLMLKNIKTKLDKLIDVQGNKNG